MNVQTTLNEIMKVIRKEVPELTTLTLWHKKEPGSTELELGMHFGVRNTQALIEEAPQREGIVRRVMEGSDILWAKRVKEQPLLRQSSMIEREALVSTAAFPLHAYGEPVGALFFSYRHEHRFTEVEKSFFPILAEFIAIAINDALILEEARREREKAEAERRIAEAERRRHRGSVAIAEAVGGNLELQHTVDQILNEVIQLFEDCWTCLVIADEDQDTLSFLSSVPKYYPITNQCYRNRDRIPLNTESIVGGLILLSRRLGGKMMSNVSDVNGAPITYKTESLERDGIPFPPDLSPRYLPLNQQTRSQCTITLFSKQNSKVLGALVLESSQSDRFSNEDEYTLWGVAKQARFALERQQLVSQIRFQDTVASMTVWASDIAHSLNREIGRIRKRTFWLQNEFALPHQANQYIDEIEHSAVTLVQVQQESQREPSDTNCVIKLVPAVTEWVENFLEERGESTCAIFHHSEEQLYAQADGTIVRRVLQDLMRNAAEAMFQQPEPKLIISTGRADPGMIEIRIEDTGPGISNGPLRARIFQEPFSTRGNNRGRGLVLARYSIEQMGGYIRLLPNEPGRGAIFAIQLPAAEVHEPQFA